LDFLTRATPSTHLFLTPKKKKTKMQRRREAPLYATGSTQQPLLGVAQSSKVGNPDLGPGGGRRKEKKKTR